MSLQKSLSYPAIVPDTLDLAERAEKALNGLTGALDVQRDYEMYLNAHLQRNPPMMHHEGSGLQTGNPKFAEAIRQMRVMCGSDLNEDIEKGMMDYIVRDMPQEALYFAHIEDRGVVEKAWCFHG